MQIAENGEAIFAEHENLRTVQVGEKQICLARSYGNLYALAATCPHASARMSDGFIDALENIVCPRHAYKFSLKNGRNVSGEGYSLKTYPLEARPEGIFVLLPAT